MSTKTSELPETRDIVCPYCKIVKDLDNDVFKRNDNKLDFCHYCRWFSESLYSACAIKIPIISQFPSLYVCYLMLIFVIIVGGF